MAPSDKQSQKGLELTCLGVLAEAFFGLLCAGAVVATWLRFTDSLGPKLGITGALLLMQNWLNGVRPFFHSLLDAPFSCPDQPLVK